MLQETVERISTNVPLDHLYVITSGDYRDVVASQLDGLPFGNIVAEPTGRGTAASIGIAAVLIAARDPRAVMGSFPADHVVTDVAAFRTAVSFAEEIARDGYLVTLGIQPTYPETGYGYIRYGQEYASEDDLCAYNVERFIEKPQREVAEQFLAQGCYVWNAGIFVWRVDRILEEIHRWVPEVGAVLDEIGAAAARSGGRMTEEVERVMWSAWPRLHENVTIDTGVMEKAGRIAVIPVSVGWNDIGSWSQVAALFPQDMHGNAIVGLEGRHIGVLTKDTLVYSTTGRVIATAGVDGLVIVDTGDYVLVCSKEHAQHVKDIVEFIKKLEQA